MGIPRFVTGSGGIYTHRDEREVPDIMHVTMELGREITIRADICSTRYSKSLENGVIDAVTPVFKFDPSINHVDMLTSATTQYFADKGLLLDYRNGRFVDTTHLHIKEGYEEAVSAIMANLACKTGRKVEWDPENEQIILDNKNNAELDKILVS